VIFFFGRSGGGGLPVFLLVFLGLFFFLPLVGRGGGALLLPLLMLAMFVLLPVMLVRSATRGAARGAGGSGWEPQPVPRQQPAPRPQPVDPTDVVSLRDRLAHDVRTLQPGDDPVLRQAMADAAERHATCSSLLERARSQDQLRTAWVAAAEGLHATRLVRERLGLHPGSTPVLPDAGPHLQQRSRVVVGDREHVGVPDYEPGRPHWFPGGQLNGRYVPAGWYATPFWPGGLVLGALGGWALGSLMAGGLMGGAFSGSAGDGQGGEGGWSGGSGGDWGGGGAGGGDWGGGDW
jgi:hypothetical protein